MNTHSEEAKDILKEIGNIGGGNALTSLSMMLDKSFDLNLPACHFVDRFTASNMLEKPDALYAGVAMTMTGTFDCVLALLLNKEFTELVIDALDEGTPEFSVESLNDMQRSALAEVGNIMGNSYITAVGNLLDTTIDVSVPHVVIDSGTNVLKAFLDDHPAKTDKLLFINSTFTSGPMELESYMLLCPTEEALATILDKLKM